MSSIPLLLIFLTKVDPLSLLQTLHGEVLIPREVLTEIEENGPEDLTVQAIIRTTWLILGETPPIPELIQAYRLGPGESSVIIWAWSCCNTINDLFIGPSCSHVSSPHSSFPYISSNVDLGTSNIDHRSEISEEIHSQ